MMGIRIGDLLHWYDGLAYEVAACLDRVESRDGCGILYTAGLLPMLGDPGNPDDWITILPIVAGDVVLCPNEWQSDPDTHRRNIPENPWVEMATGSLCVLIDGWPYLPPGSGGPDERPSFGDD